MTDEGLRGRLAVPRVRVWPAAVRGRIAGSPRLRVVRLLWELSPAAAIMLGLFVIADGVLPNLALIALGRATGRIPVAVEHGLGSPAGQSLLIALAIGAGAYGLSLVRTPVGDLLNAHCSALMTAGMQRRLARAVCTPAGIEHLEDPEVLDSLSAATGELSSTQPADAPVTLANAVGDRLGGLLACIVLATFRWWLGLLFLAGWLALRPALLARLRERATLARRATPVLRHAWYYLGAAYRAPFAKELRVFGLSDWILARHAERWTEGMTPSWASLRRLNRQVVLSGAVIAVMYLTGSLTLGLAAWHHEIALGTLAVMLPMLPMTMQVGGVSGSDVSLEQMLASVPDLDGVVTRLGAAAPAVSPGPGTGTGKEPGARGLPVREIRFEGVSYRYRHGTEDVLSELDLTLPAGHSLALVGLNGAGKTTLVTLLARLRDPAAGRITADGTDLRELDARAWQRQVAVVYQDFTRYPLSARDNVAFCDLGGPVDQAALERAAAQAGAQSLIAGLPSGWDTICSSGYQGGADLSGGQWQRIALARALYAVARGATVLVLDEPTAQLDIRAEAAFYNRFLELTEGVTTLVISHRFATVRRAERIAVLDAGRITELGTHTELLAAGGAYAEMFTLQARRFSEAGRG
jgi:ATP-binding cassette subfamily B protein